MKPYYYTVYHHNYCTRVRHETILLYCVTRQILYQCQTWDHITILCTTTNTVPVSDMRPYYYTVYHHNNCTRVRHETILLYCVPPQLLYQSQTWDHITILCTTTNTVPVSDMRPYYYTVYHHNYCTRVRHETILLYCVPRQILYKSQTWDHVTILCTTTNTVPESDMRPYYYTVYHHNYCTRVTHETILLYCVPPQILYQRQTWDHITILCTTTNTVPESDMRPYYYTVYHYNYCTRVRHETILLYCVPPQILYQRQTWDHITILCTNTITVPKSDMRPYYYTVYHHKYCTSVRHETILLYGVPPQLLYQCQTWDHITILCTTTITVPVADMRPYYYTVYHHKYCTSVRHETILLYCVPPQLLYQCQTWDHITILCTTTITVPEVDMRPYYYTVYHHKYCTRDEHETILLYCVPPQIL